jgi:lipopolysaccharide/colanic/teichoic acid biosynthesis glycosyltransferase
VSKRIVDIAVSAALLLIAAPIICVAALGSALTLRAWPFFTQDRIGHGGRAFRFVKVRTLPVDTPAYADKYAVSQIQLNPFNAMLRRLHLDELPQLALVLLGKMSLVGPRPEMPQLHGDLSPEFAAARLTIRPGCTGLWQVGDHCCGLIGEAPEYDLYYLEHQNLLLDAWVMTQTLRKVVQDGRTITLADVPAWARREAPKPLPTIIELTETAAARETTIHQLELQTATD